MTEKESSEVHQAKDKTIYVRKQKGHSLIFGWLITGPMTLFILPIYWTISPNHYWHF